GGGAHVETDACKVWQRFADQYYLCRGTPTGAWLDYELHEVFGGRDRRSGETAARVYDEVAEKLASPEFLPRALFERFNIEVLATRSEEHTSELQSPYDLVCRLLLEKKK